MRYKKLRNICIICITAAFLSGCGTAIAVVDTTATIAGGVVKTTAGVATGTVDIIIGSDD